MSRVSRRSDGIKLNLKSSIYLLLPWNDDNVFAKIFTHFDHNTDAKCESFHGKNCSDCACSCGIA